MRAPLSTIHAVLALTHKGACLPWIRLVQKDLSDMHTRVPEMASGFPPPLTAPHAWSSLMRDAKAWHDAVCKISFSDSVLDDKQAPAISVQLAHTCEDCTKCFATQQALLQHKRIAHNWRDPIFKFIDGSGKCPVCVAPFLFPVFVCWLMLRTLDGTDAENKFSVDIYRYRPTNSSLFWKRPTDKRVKTRVDKVDPMQLLRDPHAFRVVGARIGHVNN